MHTHTLSLSTILSLPFLHHRPLHLPLPVHVQSILISLLLRPSSLPNPPSPPCKPDLSQSAWQVRKDSLNHEFFERHFVPGIHYAPVDTVEEIPDTIRRLQKDPAFAKRPLISSLLRTPVDYFLASLHNHITPHAPQLPLRLDPSSSEACLQRACPRFE